MMKKSLITLTLIIVSLVGFSQITEFGKASFYADKFEGRVTASGEIFSQKKLTAAHRTLPFGSTVRVTNTENNKTVVVTINDRGPFVEDRVIDLSRAAADKLGFVKKGVAQVKVEVVQLKTNTSRPQQKRVPVATKKNKSDVAEKKPAAPLANEGVVEYYKLTSTQISPEGYGVQIASYQEAANLMKRCDEIKKQVGKDIIIQVSTANGSKVYRVMLGTFATREQAASYNQTIQSKFKGSFVKAL